MFRFLKGLVKGGGGEPPAALGIDELPAWMEDEEGRVRAGLAALVAGHRPVVLKARGRMEEVLSGFDTASMEEVSHRKLAGVTERSLPLFLKAMRASLSRDLPEDPEGFYTTAGEILKGCLSAFRGQGRYLASRFPEEMKVLRDGAGTIGRELNALTPEIARARERLHGLTELRVSLGGYGDAKRRVAVVQNEARSLEEEAARSRKSLDAVIRTLAELERGVEYQECQREISRIQNLEKDRAEASRLYQAVAVTAVHLLKKGEKIAVRRKDRDAARVLHEAVGLLEGELPIPEDVASRVLPPAQKAVAAQAAAGDYTPKNREEIDLLERPEGLLGEITGLSRRFRDISAEIATAQDALPSRPAFVKRRELEKEAEGLEKQVARMQDRLERLRGEGAELGARLTASLDEVRRRGEVLSGRPVEVDEPALP